MEEIKYIAAKEGYDPQQPPTTDLLIMLINEDRAKMNDIIELLNKQTLKKRVVRKKKK